MSTAESRSAEVYTYADPYTSDAYALDASGHGWDRLAAIAGEYARGEITWEQARAWCDDNARDLAALAHTPTHQGVATLTTHHRTKEATHMDTITTSDRTTEWVADDRIKAYSREAYASGRYVVSSRPAHPSGYFVTTAPDRR